MSVLSDDEILNLQYASGEFDAVAWVRRCIAADREKLAVTYSFTEHGKPLEAHAVTLRRGDTLTVDIGSIIDARVAADRARRGGAEAKPSAPDDFAEWLKREMPSGTVIGSPDWWAPRIYRAVLRSAPPAAAVPEEWREVMGGLLEFAEKVNNEGWQPKELTQLIVSARALLGELKQSGGEG